MTISELDLQPDVRAKAEELLRAQPHVVFTSGRRTIQDQARAMSQNVVQNRRYVAETYRASRIRDMLQRWLTAHPEAVTEAQIAAGFEHILSAVPATELRHLSAHLIGRAFDIQPHSASVGAVQALGPRQFLTHEAGLVRWHVGF